MAPDLAEHLLLFLIKPPALIAEQMAGLAQVFAATSGLQGYSTSPDRLHITLRAIWRGMGRPPSEVMGFAQQAGASVVGRRFKVTFNQVHCWSRSKVPLVLVGDEGVIGIDWLHCALSSALSLRPDPGYTPHISLLRGAGDAPVRDVQPFTWTVDELLLVDSLQGRGRHEVIDRWAL